MRRLASGKRLAFTLIELIFVITLIALLATVALPRVTSTLGMNIKSNVLEVAGFLQTGYTQAILSHKKIRITMDLDKGTFWAEDVLEPKLIPMIAETTNLDEILNTFRKRSEEDESDEDKAKREAEAFQKIESSGLQSGKIDSSLKFKSVIFPGKDSIITSGTASFFISASGINDEVVIYLSHGDNVYSIIFPPITGEPRVEKGEYVAKNG